MKVFISWSGNRSKAVAAILRDWIRCVLQATRPWISARDIDRGAIWFNELSEQLKDTSVAIVCLTQENKDRPWILFEAGAVMKGLSANRICTLLIDLEPKDIKEPLYHFNHALPTKGSMWLLVDTLNKSLGNQSLDERILVQVFDRYWDLFDSQFQEAVKANPPSEPPKPRDTSDLLAEVVENTRGISARLSKLEANANLSTLARKSRGFRMATTPSLLKAKAVVSGETIGTIVVDDNPDIPQGEYGNILTSSFPQVNEVDVSPESAGMRSIVFAVDGQIASSDIIATYLNKGVKVQAIAW